MTAVASKLEVVTGAVVFTDIVGFTEFTALEGDANALALLQVQERIVAAALPPGARVVKEMGDGLLLWFPDACEAIVTSLALQAAFEAEANESMLPLWVRMGAHWGQQTRRREDIVGHDVNIASRVAAVAGPGELLVSEPTIARAAAYLPAGYHVEELGPVVMKGIPEPIRLFRVERERGA